MADVDDIGGKPPLGALFSTDASDNAEIVPPTAPRGPESMWSTEAPVEAPVEAAADRIDEPLIDESSVPGGAGGWEFSEPAAPPPHRTVWGRTDTTDEGPFSADPVEHDDDVIDAGDLFDPWADAPPSWNGTDAPTSSVFSNGASARTAPPADDSPWTVLGDEWSDEPVTAPGRAGANRSGPFDAPRRHDTRPHDQRPHDARVHEPAAPRWADHSPAAGADVPAADPHGLESSVSRLSVADQERAAVAIAVCGALLDADEQVVGVVTGQMLGRPAAVAVTDRRVIIANDRRWQPLVDVYELDSKLVVRGRHDRQVAALSFADTTRLSMIDGITEVELAIELAERIRDADPGD